MDDSIEAGAQIQSFANAGKPAPYVTECDLVLKGGITSGVVYPLAIVEIAKAFRLRSIGGTSAGAIAAAAAAAAELGRQRYASSRIAQDPGGFDELARLPALLASDAQGRRGTRLFAFFRPKKSLRAAFNALVAAIGIKSKVRRVVSVVVALVCNYWLASLVGLAIGLIPLLSVQWSPIPWLVLIWVSAFAVILAISAACLRAARVLLKELPGNGFGFCSGIAPPGDKAPQEALTTWLAEYIDGLSGQRSLFTDKPLTFGDLKAHGIDLQMMTTCLTLGKPFRLPFRDDDQVRDNRQFIFKESEFAGLFPPNVVAWMKRNQRPFDASGSGPLGNVDFTGFLALPDPDDLPVVVAARMSLSFPILLSAIPLYSFDFRQKPLSPTPQRCWFTDGGVGSNFPIHFFDAPLPTRPTFGLDLGLAESASVRRVLFPANNNDARLPYWRTISASSGFGAIVGFLGAVIDVAKEWNHETLSHLPGFRDRIGLIKLTSQEGGLNLTMPKDLLARLTEYGREAGQQFVIRFGDPSRWPANATASKVNWENHQLIRLRLLLASLPEMLENLDKAAALTRHTPHDYDRFFNIPPCGPESYRFIGLGNLGTAPPDDLYRTQAGLAKWIYQQLLLIATRIAQTVASHPDGSLHPGINAPKPAPELKPRPRV